MILVTDRVLPKEIYEKAKFTYDDLKKKKKLSKIVRNLDIKKLKNIEKVCSEQYDRNGYQNQDYQISRICLKKI